MYVLEIMHDGVSHGYEYHEDEITYDESGVTLLDEKGREIARYSMEDEVALIDETNLDLRDWRANYLGHVPLDPRTGAYTNRVYTNPRWGR
jgi:hypothetical protein